jgi:hypothetical protein
MQAKYINSNGTDDRLTASSMVQQSMTDLSGAVIEQEKVMIITKVVFQLLTNNSNISSQTSENHSIQY